MTCACCHEDAGVLTLRLDDRGVLALCRACWLIFCGIASDALAGKDNESREGTH